MLWFVLGPQTRHPYTTILMCAWATGELILLAIAYTISDWRWQVVAVGIAGALVCIPLIWILESPRLD